MLPSAPASAPGSPAEVLASAPPPAPSWPIPPPGKSGFWPWRAQREQELRAPDSWLTLVGLEWLKTGINSFGSAPDNAIRIHAEIPSMGLLTVIETELPGKARVDRSKANTPPEPSAAIVQLLAPRDGFPAGFDVDGAPVREGPLNVDGNRNPRPSPGRGSAWW